jgi:hypothetical protein
MLKRNLLIVVLLIGLVLALTGLLIRLHGDKGRISNLNYKCALALEIWKELPPGTDKQSVLQFLERKQIPHSDYRESGDMLPTIVRAGGLIESRMKAEPAFPYDATFDILFKFNTNGKLEGYESHVEYQFF